MFLQGLSLAENKTIQFLRNTNHSIRFGLIPEEPYIFDCYTLPRHQCHTPGLGVEVIREICGVLSVPCSLIKVDHSNFGDNYNGTWQGMIRQIMDGEFDTSMPIFNPTAEREKVVDFSMSLYGDRTSLVTRLPDPSNFSPMAVFAFSWQAALLLIATVSLLGFLTFLMDFSDPKGNSALSELRGDSTYCTRLVRRWVDVASLLVQQGPNQNLYHTAAFYVIFTTWGLSCIVFIGVYSSFILLTALAQKQELPFEDINSLADCVAAARCRMITSTLSSSYYEEIFKAQSGNLYELRLALTTHPPKVVPLLSDRARMVLDSETTFDVMIVAGATHSLLVQQHQPCVFEAVQRKAQTYSAFPFVKNSSLRTLFDKAIMTLQTNGVLFALHDKYVGAHINSNICKKSLVGSQATALETFLGPFLLLFLGAVLSVLALLCEKAQFSRAKSANQRETNSFLG